MADDRTKSDDELTPQERRDVALHAAVIREIAVNDTRDDLDIVTPRAARDTDNRPTERLFRNADQPPLPGQSGWQERDARAERIDTAIVGAALGQLSNDAFDIEDTIDRVSGDRPAEMLLMTTGRTTWVEQPTWIEQAKATMTPEERAEFEAATTPREAEHVRSYTNSANYPLDLPDRGEIVSEIIERLGDTNSHFDIAETRGGFGLIRTFECTEEFLAEQGSDASPERLIFWAPTLDALQVKIIETYGVPHEHSPDMAELDLPDPRHEADQILAELTAVSQPPPWIAEVREKMDEGEQDRFDRDLAEYVDRQRVADREEERHYESLNSDYEPDEFISGVRELLKTTAGLVTRVAVKTGLKSEPALPPRDRKIDGMLAGLILPPDTSAWIAEAYQKMDKRERQRFDRDLAEYVDRQRVSERDRDRAAWLSRDQSLDRW